MNLRIFIERPVLSAVLSIVIVVVGIIGLFTLPVEQYPDIAPPTVQVYTAYDGASAETVQLLPFVLTMQVKRSFKR